MNVIETVKQLDLPVGEYVVYGSAPMAVKGLRAAADIDIILTKNLYDQLKERGWKEGFSGDGSLFLSHGNIEAFTSWDFGGYHPVPEELIMNAEIIEGIPFASLEEVVRWKTALGREKDQRDIEAIRAYLDSKQLNEAELHLTVESE